MKTVAELQAESVEILARLQASAEARSSAEKFHRRMLKEAERVNNELLVAFTLERPDTPDPPAKKARR